MTSNLPASKIEKIAALFAAGHSLDRVSEWGVHYHWTRDDVKQVVRDKGWTLAWDGRLLPRYIPRAPIPEGRSMADVDTEGLLEAGIDHELVEIRRLAVKAQSALDALRSELIRQEERDAEEVASRRREEEKHDAELRDPSCWPHGTWGGYKRHLKYDVPMCLACDEAGQRYREEASVSKRTRNHKYRQEAASASLAS